MRRTRAAGVAGARGPRPRLLLHTMRAAAAAVRAAASAAAATTPARGPARSFRVRDVSRRWRARSAPRGGQPRPPPTSVPFSQLFVVSPERRARLAADLQKGGFDDLAGAATLTKPFAARALVPGAVALPPLPVRDANDGGRGGATDLATALAVARAAAGHDAAAPALLLVGARSSSDAALDGWAAAWWGGGGGEPGLAGPTRRDNARAPPSLPLIDLTLYDRASPLLLALPLGRRALLAGASRAAARRGADAALAHFGPGDALRSALGLTNALAGYAALVDGRGGVRWLGAGVPTDGEVSDLLAAVASLAVGGRGKRG